MGSDDLFKKRKSPGDFKRKIKTRGTPKDSFLIVCEGEKTEPNYFNSFKVKTATIKVKGLGYDPKKLVDETVQLKKIEEYDQTWCVFDKDNVANHVINDAFSTARKNKINIAFSNEAFELWYLLHFHYYNTGIGRKDYIYILHDLLGEEYKKNSVRMYEKLLDKQPNAIKLAEKLYSSYNNFNPNTNNPITTVHKLVIELNRFI